MTPPNDQSFSGTCPTCGQRYCGAEIERLRADIAFVQGERDGYRRISDQRGAEIERLRAEVGTLCGIIDQRGEAIERLRADLAATQAALRDAHELISNDLVGPWAIHHRRALEQARKK